ncbi:hypothetical protein ARSEF4850_008514 [Beauveria asiatica]
MHLQQQATVATLSSVRDNLANGSHCTLTESASAGHYHAVTKTEDILAEVHYVRVPIPANGDPASILD